MNGGDEYDGGGHLALLFYFKLTRWMKSRTTNGNARSRPYIISFWQGSDSGDHGHEQKVSSGIAQGGPSEP